MSVRCHMCHRSGKTAVDEAKMFTNKETSKKMLDILLPSKNKNELEKIEEHFDLNISVPIIEISTNIM